MCSSFLKMMENYQGDLSDVVRATTAATDGGSTAAELAAAPAVSWQFSRNAVNYSSDPADHQDFGDPFSYIRDPHPPMQNAPLSELFYGGGGAGDAGINGGGGVNPAHGVVDDMKRPAANIFSRMLQISPTPKLPCDSHAAAAPPQRGLKGPPLLVSNNGSLISPSSSDLQISSPRNTGIKRRKSQAKKVVCIPAPAPANSRATGEIVPSDLWAWRKYGQKPIKGSPYPRGYYRCSSSKGCSARKQVERSRTDPNMLVITYTSEHNHPWPTQRNALAGSTRSQASKNSAKNSSPNSHTEKPTNTKQDHQETSSTVEENCGAVKEEAEQELENQFEAEFDEEFPHTYNPTLPASSSNHHDQDNFFADLGEIGDDPLNLFQQGFPRDNHHNDLDQFTFYDWATNTNPITATATTTTTTVAATTTLGAAEESKRHS